MREESFEDLEISSYWKYQTRATMSHKIPSFKVFAKLHRSPLLIANKVKTAVSGLRQFLATESSLKRWKMLFYFALEAIFALKNFKFLSLLSLVM